jgi:DNA repair exonuclease SbcCD ATPase subunit
VEQERREATDERMAALLQQITKYKSVLEEEKTAIEQNLQEVDNEMEETCAHLEELQNTLKRKERENALLEEELKHAREMHDEMMKEEEVLRHFHINHVITKRKIFQGSKKIKKQRRICSLLS